jgi:hypothetical protein
MQALVVLASLSQAPSPQAPSTSHSSHLQAAPGHPQVLPRPRSTSLTGHEFFWMGSLASQAYIRHLLCRTVLCRATPHRNSPACWVRPAPVVQSAAAPTRQVPLLKTTATIMPWSHASSSICQYTTAPGAPALRCSRCCFTQAVCHLCEVHMSTVAFTHDVFIRGCGW